MRASLSQEVLFSPIRIEVLNTYVKDQIYNLQAIDWLIDFTIFVD